MHVHSAFQAASGNKSCPDGSLVQQRWWLPCLCTDRVTVNIRIALDYILRTYSIYPRTCSSYQQALAPTLWLQDVDVGVISHDQDLIVTGRH